MRDKVGAEQLQQVPSLDNHVQWVFRSARTALVGPTHAALPRLARSTVGIGTDGLEVRNHDWGAACVVERCPGCYADVAQG